MLNAYGSGWLIAAHIYLVVTILIGTLALVMFRYSEDARKEFGPALSAPNVRLLFVIGLMLFAPILTLWVLAAPKEKK